MKKVLLSTILFVLVSIVVVGCSKSVQDQVIGKWKREPVKEMEQMGIKFESTIEFAKDKMTFETKINDKSNKIEVSYVIKKADGQSMIIDATPINIEPKDKAEIKLTLNGNKLTFLGPDNKPFDLTRM